MLRFRRGGKWALVFAALVSLVAFVAVACGGDDDDGGSGGETPTGGQTPAATKPSSQADKLKAWYESLKGDVRVDGSSTVFPVSQAVAEEFSKVAKGVQAKVALSGTGGGFEKFCRKEIDVSNASRPITQKEKDACAANGIPESDLVEIQVAIDALTVVVNPQNTWAKCMTTAQVQKAFQADEGGTPIKWSDLDPSWPNETIRFFFPGTDSGTFDYFKEAIKLRGSERNEPAHRPTGPNATSSEDDNILVKGVEGNKYALGYFGFAYFEEAGKLLKAVEIDGGKGCVAPTFENAISGKYTPLSRPLFIYTTKPLLSERKDVLGFVKFYVDNMEELAKDVGYISLPPDMLKQQQAKVEPFLPAELK
ncbi:PstS family phosphate ABC transporter substrate-binding protein [Tepidiforma sp.]|uniref:PstS family phosphate ABC transporter substrate-binding protein n=1 Tax=Tepidiforma sp. TaxID=2682230 RepID=UPI002ADE68F8|nr:PstS family phosphate ABC transporter substrate-binding protein [Tepidiforma sp.]